MLKIVLINPPSLCVDDDRLEPSLGLLYIASMLRQNHFQVVINEMTGCKTEAEISKKIKEIPEGDIFGISVLCTNYPYVKYCIEQIRLKNEKAFIIVGGPNATALPDFTLSDSKCDCVITGEGEDAFLQAVKTFQRGETPPAIIKGIRRDDIDSYPMPAWDLVDLGSFTRVFDGEKTASLISSRGCSHHCTHCNSTVMGGGSMGVRYRKAERVVSEMRYLSEFGIRRFRFNDDNFTGNPNLGYLLRQIKELNIRYRVFGRIEDLTSQNCQLLAESGCKHISVGLESLNPDNLRALGKKSQSGFEAIHLKNAKENGITIRVYFIIGLPYDNEYTIKKYYGLAKDLPFDEYSIYPLIPYPGTAIAERPQDFGYKIIDNDFTHYVQIGKNRSSTFILRHTNFTEYDVKRWYDYVDKLFSTYSKIRQSHSKIAL
jgi:radical SAM superfamily enzyme YgiQ (UPF0313 family)